MRLVDRDAERAGEIRSAQVVPQGQLDDLAFARIERGYRRHDKLLERRQIRAPRLCLRRVGHLASLLQGGKPGPAAQPPVALVAGDGVEPGPEAVWITQIAELGSRDDEGVLNRIGRVGWLGQQRPAISV